MDEGAIDRAMRRPRRYWYEDGIAEIATGIVFLLVALVFYAEASRIIGRGFSSIGLIVVVFFGVRFVRRAVNAAKARLIYPRTGSVTYRQQPRLRRKLIAAAVAGVVVAAVATLGLLQTGFPIVWIPLADGVLIAAYLVYLGNTQALKRFYALAMCSLVAGGAAALIADDDIAGTAIYFAITGAALILSGGAVLLHYLRQPITPDEE